MNSNIWDLNILNPTLVMDNCSIHIENSIAQWCQETGWDFVFLPPYSPMLNPIEECFSVLKSQIKKLLTDEYNRRRMINAQRIVLLEEVLNRSLPSIIPQIVQNCYNHMMDFLPKCILLEDM